MLKESSILIATGLVKSDDSGVVQYRECQVILCQNLLNTETIMMVLRDNPVRVFVMRMITFWHKMQVQVIPRNHMENNIRL